MALSISPTIPSITINGNTYAHADFENNLPGTLGGLGNDLASTIAALELVGTLTKAITGNTTLTADEGQNLVFIFTGSLTGDATITFPAGFTKAAYIINSTTGGFGLTLGLAAGNTVAIPVSGGGLVYCDGTEFGHVLNESRTSTGARVIGSLEVNNTATISGATTVTGALTASSTASIAGAATVSGALTGLSANLSGNATVGGTLSVTGAGTFDSATEFGTVTVGPSNIDLAGSVTTGELSVTGSAWFTQASVEQRLKLKSPAETSTWIEFASSGERWLIGRNSVAETGSDVGSDFEITRESDAGVPLGIPVKIMRSSGNILFSELPTSASGLATGTLWNNSGVVNIVT
jgi:hypothetical protein